MADITEAGVQEKLNKGEALSKEETAFVMSGPPEGVAAPVDTDPNKPEERDDVIIDEEKPPSGKKDEDAEKPGEDKGKEAVEAEKKTDDGKKAEASEKPEPEAPKKTDDGTLHGKVEKEIDKPDGQEDLSGFSEREKGLFYEMKKSRKRAQKAEEDRDALMFERIKAAKLAQEGKTEKPVEEEEDLFGKDADPDDFPTVGKLREITKKAGERESAARRARDRAITVRLSEMTARQIVEVRSESGKDAPDYDEVMELAPVIVEGNPDYQKQIYDAYVKGKNAALLTYDIIRKDPKFTALFKPSAEAPKEAPKKDTADEGKKTLEKINANEKKPKTSGSGGAGGGEGGEEYTFEQLLRMTSGQFKKVPKTVRDKFLYNS